MSDLRQQPPPPPSSSLSQQQQQQQQHSAFAYPSPASHLPTRTDLSLREIIDTYRDNQELLKQVLAAKAEEEKRRAEEEKYKTEQLRLQCKQVELEMLREQKKPPTILTGMPPINTSYSVKSPSDIHSPSYSIPPPMGTVDTHYSTTTPTSATRMSPPTSATNADTTSFSSLNPSSSNYQIGQRPTLTLAIPTPSFPLVTSSPTSTHAPHSFSTTPTTMQDSPHHHRHHHHVYTQSPTSATSAGTSVGHKRPKPSEPEVDHQYVMEAIRQKVRQNAENPAKKQAGVVKTRSSSTPVVSITSPAGTTSTSQSPSSQAHTRPHSSHPSTHSHSPCTHNSQHVHSPHTAQPLQSPHTAHPQHQSPHQHVSSPVHPQPQQPTSSNGAPLTHTPLPPMTVHSPVLNQEGVAKS